MYNSPMKYDTGIVLGHVQFKKGPSARQKKRLNKSLSLFKQGEIDSIITTGGLGMFNRTNVPLARWAKDYLVEIGMPFSKVYMEEKSKDTIDNAKNALEIMKKREMKSAIVITSIDHIARAKVIFKDVFPKNIPLKFVVSDYHWGVLTFWDLAWQIGGWIKYYLKKSK